MSGKYVIYHERFRVYLLQKISDKATRAVNLQLITLIENSLKGKAEGELEAYGLEFLIEHLALEAILTGDGLRMLQWAYSPTHWDRQLKISKVYTWTNKDLQMVMTWASKYNGDEVIQCGLNMVDLHFQEQNTTAGIIALMAEGDIESTLMRIENFGGARRSFNL